jgi:hypothetical protein
MTIELLSRVHKELSITGLALYETILSISELVNRKVQILRLHWQASALLHQIDTVMTGVGRQIATQVSDRLLHQDHPDSMVGAMDHTLADAMARVQELKHALTRVEAQIRELKIETVHQDLLSLQRDLALRSGGIERLTVVRGAPAAGQSLNALPPSSSVYVAAVLRGPFVLAPTTVLAFRPGDIVVLLGPQADLDQLVPWFTGQRPLTPSLMRSTVEGRHIGGDQIQ